MTSARDFCEASPRLLQRLLASASRCSRKTSTSSNFQRPGGHPAVTTSRNRPAGSFHPRWPPLDPARRTVDEQRQHACVRLRSACMGNVCCRLRLAHSIFWFARNQSRHGRRPEAAFVQEAAMASSGTGRREEAPEE